MPAPRPYILLTGALLALLAGILVVQGSHLGADLPRTALLGVSLGAVIGLVKEQSVVARTGGFLLGLAAAWMGYALRAGYLPDIAMGRAIAAFVVVLLVASVAAGSANRVPLWTGLLGVAAMVGAYETAFSADPTSFLTDSVTAVTTVLLASALGILLAAVLATPPPPVNLEEDDEEVPLDALLLPSPRASVDATAHAATDEQARA